MVARISGFQWDRGNWPKCGKHGVSRAEIEALFSGDVAVRPDPDHSDEEERFFAIGSNSEGRWLFVVFTPRRVDGHTLIRPLSARYMHRKEVEHYAQQKDS